MRRTGSPARRALLFAASALAMSAPCCGGDGGAPISQVTSLRVLSVTASKPYAKAGDEVTFGMTYADALSDARVSGDAGAGAGAGTTEDGPREVEVVWLAGCKNPLGGVYEGCFLQLPAIVAGSMQAPQTAAPEQSGVADAVSFKWTVPEDILEGAEPTETGTVYSTAYVFFVVCAGNVQPASADAAGFPLECVDKKTRRVLGAESFVVGYTQIYIFGDERQNTNPPIDGVTLDGALIEEDPEGAPTVARCELSASQAEAAGCSQQEPSASECPTFKIEALIGDVAEVDPESSEPGGPPVREAVWVDYMTDGGSIKGFKKLVNDVTSGYREDHATTWTPPAEPGLVTIWAVAHDARGGASVKHRYIRVE